MENYVLSLAAIFYRDPIDSYYDIHEIFDFDKNALNFKNFTMNIRATGGADGPEDWAGAFNLAKNLSWQNDSLKFIVHIADAPGHGLDYVGSYDKYPREGNKTDEILTYFAKNNFSIAGFETNSNSGGPSFKRAQKIFRDNGNLNYLFKYYSTYEIEEDYLLNSVYDSFQYIQSTAVLHGIDISEEQGDIDWNKIKTDKSVDFVIIRAGIGNETDSKFIDNYNEAKDAGIPIGIYWYAKARNKKEAVAEAEACKNVLEGKQFEFPIYYVMEDSKIFSGGYYNDILNYFCDNLNSLNTTNYLCGLRTFSSKLQYNFDISYLDDYQIWAYDNDNSQVTKVDPAIFKYNDHGVINGINGSVSLDQSFINYTKITLENNYNGFSSCSTKNNISEQFSEEDSFFL